MFGFGLELRDEGCCLVLGEPTACLALGQPQGTSGVPEVAVPSAFYEGEQITELPCGGRWPGRLAECHEKGWSSPHPECSRDP